MLEIEIIPSVSKDSIAMISIVAMSANPEAGLLLACVVFKVVSILIFSILVVIHLLFAINWL